MAGFSKTGGNRGICGHLQPRLRKNYIWKQQFHLYHSQSPASRSANERQPEDCAARRGIRARRTRRRLKACGLSLCGCRPIVIPKNTGRGGDAVQAQGLRPFAMWLSPHIHPEKYRPENPQAASRPVFFGMTARLVEKIKNPLTTGRRSDNVCVRRC